MKSLTLLLVLLLAQGEVSKAQVSYRLSEGLSRLYWPFGDGTTWNDKRYNQNQLHYCRWNGSDCHDYSDFYAQDWYINLAGSSSCWDNNPQRIRSKNIYSPVYGRVMYVDNHYNRNTDFFGCQLIIEITDENGFWTGHALRIAHIEEGSISVYKGQSITPYTLLARVGSTGPEAGPAHPHLVLYKGIDQWAPTGKVGREALKKGESLTLGKMCEDATPNERISDGKFAAEFILDATVNPNFGCQQAQVNLNGNIGGEVYCRAFQQASITGRVTQTGKVRLISPNTTINNFKIDHGGTVHLKLEPIPQKTTPKPLHNPTEAPDFAIAPNPSSAEVQITFRMEAETSYSLEVYDLQGRKVQEITRGRSFPGNHIRNWDGADQNGHPLPAGTYLLVLITGKERKVLKLVRQ